MLYYNLLLKVNAHQAGLYNFALFQNIIMETSKYFNRVNIAPRSGDQFLIRSFTHDASHFLF